MERGIYINSIFDALDDLELGDYLNGIENVEPLKEIFSVMPQRATEFSAGYDLSVLSDTVIPAHSDKLVVFGDVVRVNFSGVVGMVVPRSSLARKKGLIFGNGPEFVMENCRRLAYDFINFTDHDVELKAGEKIAQVVFIKVPTGLSKLNSFDLLDSSLTTSLCSNLELLNGGFVDSINKDRFYFQSPVDLVVESGKVACLMTGVRCRMDSDSVFLMLNAFDNPNVCLANCVGVVDADYYGNPDNGGEIGVLLLNRGIRPVKVNAGDAIASGAIYKYVKCDDDVYGGKRVGGFGSTDK